jgi:aquaporin-4
MAISCCRQVLSSSIDDLRSGYFWLGLIAEGLGTFVLVLIGCGTCLGGTATDGSTTSWENFEPTKVQISLAFGLAVATIVWNLAHISGGHINPAVTVAMLFTRKISAVRAVLYVFAQCAGAVAGAAVLAGLTPVALHGQLGLTTVNPELTKEQGFGVELIITFVLVLTVFACCDSNRTDLNGSAPLTIGLSVTLCHLFAVSKTVSVADTIHSAYSFDCTRCCMLVRSTNSSHW